MTPSELRIKRLGLAYRPMAFAARIGVPYRSYHSWEAGERRIPGWLPKMLELLEGVETPLTDGELKERLMQ
jgi:DNA-binding transcriptional regulator YiaG